MSMDNNYVEGMNDTIKQLSLQMNELETEVNSTMTDLNAITNDLSQTKLPLEGFDLAKAREQLKDFRYKEGIINVHDNSIPDFIYPDGNSVPCGMKFNDRWNKDESEILPATATELMEDGTYRHRQIGHDVTMFSYPWIKLIVTYAYADGIYCCICRDNTIRTIVPGNDPDSDPVVYSHIVDEVIVGYITISPVIPKYNIKGLPIFTIRASSTLNYMDFVNTVTVTIKTTNAGNKTVDVSSINDRLYYKTVIRAAGAKDIYRSTDGGAIWNIISLDSLLGDKDKACIINYNRGIWILITVGGDILRSTDDGVTWSISISGSHTIKNLVYGNGIWAATYRSSNSSGIIKSVDDGLTWSTVQLSQRDDTNATLLYNFNVWMYISFNLHEYRSTDNWATWTDEIHMTMWANYFRSSYINNHTIIAIDSGNDENEEMARYFEMYRSDDNGISWSSARAGITIDDPLAFPLTKIYYANGVWIAIGESSDILRSTDDGLTWTPIFVNRNGIFLNDICYSNHTWIISNTNEYIFRSIDNGLSWECTWGDEISGYRKGLKTISCCDGIWIVTGSDDTVLRSTDDGLTWTKQRINDVSNAIVDISVVIGDRVCPLKSTYEKGEEIQWDTIFLKSALTDSNWPYHLVLTNKTRGSIYHVSQDMKQITEEKNVSTMIPHTDDVTHRSVAYGNGKTLICGNAGIYQLTDNGPLPVLYSNITLRDIYYANNTWIGVGTTGTILRSTDNGLTWTKITVSGVSNDLYSIDYANNTWIAVGYTGTILRSTDNGLTWTKITVSGVTRILQSAHYSSNTWIIVGDSGTILRSTDNGLSWSKIYSGVSDHFNCIYYANNTWIAVGSNGLMLRSTDNGLTWARITAEISIGYLSHIHYSNNTWIAVGDSGTIFRSTDNGLTWSKTSVSGVTSNLHSITFAVNTWIAVGYSGTILRSTDNGLTWSKINTTGVTDYLNSIYYANTTWIAVGYSGAIVRSTDNGLTWSKTSVSGASAILNNIHYANNTWIIVGTGGTILRSTDDGLTWAKITVSGSLENIYYANNTWIIVGAGGIILRSTDNGLTWTKITVAGVSGYLYNTYYANNTWIAVGVGGTILRSTDNGLTWNMISVSGVTNALRSIHYSNNVWIIVGDSGIILRSTDNGLTWSKTNSGVSDHLRYAAYVNNTWIGVGTGNIILRSTDDGLNWTKLAVYGMASSLLGIHYANNTWIAVGSAISRFNNNNGVYYNTDILNLDDIVNYKLSGIAENEFLVACLPDTPYRNRLSLYNKESKLTDYIYDYGKSIDLMNGHGTAARTNYNNAYTLVDKFISAVTNRYADTLGLSQIEDFTYIDGFDKVLGTYFYIGQKSQNQPSGLIKRDPLYGYNLLNYSKIVVRTAVVGPGHVIPNIKQYQPIDLPNDVTSISPRAIILQIKGTNLSGLLFTFAYAGRLDGYLTSSSKPVLIEYDNGYPEMEFLGMYNGAAPMNPPEGLYTFYLIY